MWIVGAAFPFPFKICRLVACSHCAIVYNYDIWKFEGMTFCLCVFPLLIMQEGVSSTIESFSHLARASSLTNYCKFNEQSKVEKLLGGGKGWNHMMLDVL